MKTYFPIIFSLIAIACSSTKKIVKTSSTVNKNWSTIKTKPENINIDKRLLYIEQFANLAMDQMHKFKIPASITLAQGIIESNGGNSDLAKKSNNHFSIKCHSDWSGPTTYHDDDEKNECFRKYQSPSSSYRDHSIFLTQRSRYARLFKLKINDYKNWAKELKKAGYATDPKYPEKLIHVIENYDLHKFDDIVLNKKKYSPKKQLINYFKNDNYHIVKKKETLYSISKKYNISIDEIKKLNHLKNDELSINQKVKVK